MVSNVDNHRSSNADCTNGEHCNAGILVLVTLGVIKQRKRERAALTEKCIVAECTKDGDRITSSGGICHYPDRTPCTTDLNECPTGLVCIGNKCVAPECGIGMPPCKSDRTCIGGILLLVGVG